MILTWDRHWGHVVNSLSSKLDGHWFVAVGQQWSLHVLSVRLLLFLHNPETIGQPYWWLSIAHICECECELVVVSVCQVSGPVIDFQFVRGVPCLIPFLCPMTVVFLHKVNPTTKPSFHPVTSFDERSNRQPLSFPWHQGQTNPVHQILMLKGTFMWCCQMRTFWFVGSSVRQKSYC